MPIGHPVDERADADALRRGSDESHGGPRFEDGPLPVERVDKVVPDPDRVESGTLGPRGRPGQLGPRPLRRHGANDRAEFQSEPHASAPARGMPVAVSGLQSGPFPASAVSPPSVCAGATQTGELE